MTKVWIVDDHVVSQFAMEYSIHRSNCSMAVKRFDSASECLNNLQNAIPLSQDVPDIILLDLQMPNMNGWEFLNKVKEIAGYNNTINVFIISAYLNEEDRAIARDHHLVKGYFDKPLSKISVDRIFQSANTSVN